MHPRSHRSVLHVCSRTGAHRPHSACHHTGAHASSGRPHTEAHAFSCILWSPSAPSVRALRTGARARRRCGRAAAHDQPVRGTRRACHKKTCCSASVRQEARAARVHVLLMRLRAHCPHACAPHAPVRVVMRVMREMLMAWVQCFRFRDSEHAGSHR
jgi:hypothetical protein